MNSSQLLGITTLAYLLSAILYIAIFVFRAKKLGLFTTLITACAFLINTIGIGLRWHESYQMGIGYAPLSNMYESLVFFAWAITLFYLVLELRYKNRVLGAFSMPFAFLSMAYASFSPEFGKEIKPLIPALQSNWLIAHVITCFVGYAAFAVASGMGVMYLLKDRKTNGAPGTLLASLPELKVIDDIIHKTLVFGFLWLSAGIITGAVWANAAWGTYWSWDPKETWALIVWLNYAAWLHMRLMKGLRGQVAAWWALTGLLVTTFAFLGVNMFLSGLHSYGKL